MPECCLEALEIGTDGVVLCTDDPIEVHLESPLPISVSLLTQTSSWTAQASGNHVHPITRCGDQFQGELRALVLGGIEIVLLACFLDRNLCKWFSGKAGLNSIESMLSL